MPQRFRSPCPIARALDLVGDRWTLLVLRSLFRGPRRYADFLKEPEGVSTNILADRLELLLREGLIERRLYQARPPRYDYVLTARGADFLPVLQALAGWSRKHIEGCWTPPEAFLNGRPEDFLPAPAAEPPEAAQGPA